MQKAAQAVAKKEPTALATTPIYDGGEEILSSNVVIPKLLLMQALSDFVVEKTAESGDFIRQSTREKVGNFKEGVELIPLTFTNIWILKEKIGNKFEWRGMEPMTAANQDLPWNFEKNGGQWTRTKCLNVYALLPKDIKGEMAELEKAKNGEMPDPDKALLPVVIQFRVTSFPAGKDVVTQFAKAKKFGLPGYVSTLKLSAYLEKNDQGSFYVMDVKTAGPTPKEYHATCEYWKKLIASGKTQLDVSDETETVGGDRF